MWSEFRTAFEQLSEDPEVRVVVLTGSAKSFSTGIDLSMFLDIDATLAEEPCGARQREGLARIIQHLQDSVSATERCRVPVIAAISGYCIGGAVDVVTACDLRLCTADAKFGVRETDLGMVS
jgi:enoyl-CoA hydratase